MDFTRLATGLPDGPLVMPSGFPTSLQFQSNTTGSEGSFTIYRLVKADTLFGGLWCRINGHRLEVGPMLNPIKGQFAESPWPHNLMALWPYLPGLATNWKLVPDGADLLLVAQQRGSLPYLNLEDDGNNFLVSWELETGGEPAFELDEAPNPALLVTHSLQPNWPLVTTDPADAITLAELADTSRALVFKHQELGALVAGLQGLTQSLLHPHQPLLPASQSLESPNPFQALQLLNRQRELAPLPTLWLQAWFRTTTGTDTTLVPIGEAFPVLLRPGTSLTSTEGISSLLTTLPDRPLLIGQAGLTEQFTWLPELWPEVELLLPVLSWRSKSTGLWQDYILAELEAPNLPPGVYGIDLTGIQHLLAEIGWANVDALRFRLDAITGGEQYPMCESASTWHVLQQAPTVVMVIAFCTPGGATETIYLQPAESDHGIHWHSITYPPSHLLVLQQAQQAISQGEAVVVGAGGHWHRCSLQSPQVHTLPTGQLVLVAKAS